MSWWLYLASFIVILEKSEVGSYITDSGGWDMYMDDEDGGTIADQVTKFVSRFVDRVGTEAGISPEHLKSLYTMIPGQLDWDNLDFFPGVIYWYLINP